MKRSQPFIYILDYGDHARDPGKSLDAMSESPPDLLHVGQDLVYVSPSGIDVGMKACYHAIAGFLSEAKLRGVKWAIPYICNQTIVGDPVARSGFWQFYDNWDLHREDLGKKPEDDPLEWLQREPWGKIHFNYPHRFPKFQPPRRWAPCPNHPSWRAFLMAVVAGACRCGYDGLFVDNNMIHCHCIHCQRGFRDYLGSRYGKADLKRRFGTDDVNQIGLSTAGDKVVWAKSQPGFRTHLADHVSAKILKDTFGTLDQDAWDLDEAGGMFLWSRSRDFLINWLSPEYGRTRAWEMILNGDLEAIGLDCPREMNLWFETQRYWACSIASMLREFREIGQHLGNDHFMVIPNCGGIAGMRERDGRKADGRHLGIYAPSIDFAMFEEAYYPGLVAPGVIFDYVFHYKHALSCGTRAVVLTYHGGNTATVELAFAEAAAFSGGGAFVQPNYDYPQVRGLYRRLYSGKPWLWRGMRSYAPVAIVFSFNQLFAENIEHYRQAHVLAQQMLDKRIPFDLLAEDYASRLGQYRVVVLPNLRYVSDAEISALEAFVASGQTLVVVGDPLTRDETAKERNPPGLQRIAGNVANRGRILALSKETAAPDLPTGKQYLVDLPEDELLARMETIEDEGGADRPTGLVDAIAEKTRRDFSLATGKDLPPTLRLNAYTNGKHLIVHLVNYDQRLFAGDISGCLEDLDLTLNWGRSVRGITYHAPGARACEDLSFSRVGGRLELVLPRLSIYGVLEIKGKG